MKQERTESYSSLSRHEQCPLSYKLRYIDKCDTYKRTLMLELGELTHKVMELKLQPNSHYSAEQLKEIFYNGYTDNNEEILGFNELKSKYFKDYLKPNNKSGLSYDTKEQTFLKRIESDEDGLLDNSSQWKVLAVEFPFEIVYNGIKVCGKIDRIDINKDFDFRITDYKSSDSSYDEKKLATPLQMYIYSRAIKKYFNGNVVSFVYDFTLLDIKQNAMTANWEKRGDKKLTNILNKLTDNYTNEQFVEKPSPLCYWCEYNPQGLVKDSITNGKCLGYSLWTPTNKVWATNKTNTEAFPLENTNKVFTW